LIDGNTYIHSITTSRLLTSMTLGESPEQGVCQGIFAEVGEDLIVNLESSEVG
jgi:hypothetical protein